MTRRRFAHTLLFGFFALAVAHRAWGGGLDTDGDGIADLQDNCTLVANPAQRDTDADSIGNVCDPDIAMPNDLFVNFLDLNVMKTAFFTNPASPVWNPDADLTGDNFVNFQDLIIMQEFFFSAPGPSGIGSGPTYTGDVQPVFAEKCAPCHTGLGVGGHNVGSIYSDAFLLAEDGNCDGMVVGECTIVLIQAGDMPEGAGCSGDPALDAGNASCLTQAEQDVVQAWIDSGLPE